MKNTILKQILFPVVIILVLLTALIVGTVVKVFSSSYQDEINQQNGTAYQSEDVYFKFTRETLTNASDNAQIELTEAQTQQTRVNTILNLMSQAPAEQLRKDLCELLDWDYDEIKDSFPDNPEEALQTAQNALNEVNPES